jgi:hypothetical protein
MGLRKTPDFEWLMACQSCPEQVPYQALARIAGANVQAASLRPVAGV